MPAWQSVETEGSVDGFLSQRQPSDKPLPSRYRDGSEVSRARIDPEVQMTNRRGCHREELRHCTGRE
ncbi:hypothetical protein M438DRAFT_345997 [Aureobasidium pullulans EXF-150]|uniref:Uncharacterized protein n=1 Tax=Aureobasidium pullulans EXF-150 TaxID=1043002 RepID=A0A074XPK3_AURPU|nr:uncharacterized protein M438DRAFT_345997 [Aureobasidium pullulans EXF-150]KEQ83902.1 hypothetical protein M438DRAFT_345997 [Aureobasidium pullulans EXF-150]